MEKRTRSISLFFIIVIILLANGDIRGEDNPLLPSWFWDTPQVAGAALAVGYSDRQVKDADFYKQAILDGAWRLFTYRSCRIVGDKAGLGTPEGLLNVCNTIHIEIDSSGFEDFFKSLVVIDSFSYKDYPIVLISTREVSVDKTQMKSPKTSDSCDFGDGSVSGISPQHYYFHSAWMKAETTALFELAISKYSQERTLRMTLNDLTQLVTVRSTDVIISDARALHRCYDKELKMVLVWVAGKVAYRN
jgi:hypothetical protein